MIELLVISDDFTGALDTGVQFAKRGITTAVYCARAFEANKFTGDTRVVCIDAETRHLSPDEAYQIVFSIAKAAFDAGVGIIYKKVDSTLRGQIGSELGAMLDAAKGHNLAFAPAFPATGRTTINGRQLVYGKPIHDSVFANDPFEPITRSDISGIIKNTRTLETENVPIAQAPSGLMTGGVEIYDAITDEDLDLIARRLMKNNYRLMGGSAGLALAYSQLMTAENRRGGYYPPALPIKKNALLAVCGSLNPISARQIDKARQNGFLTLELPEWLIDGQSGEKASDYKELLGEVCELLECGGRLILTAANARENGDYSVARERVASRIGQFIRDWRTRGQDAALVIVGGDTLYAFLSALGGDAQLRPLCELQPGVVLSQIRHGDKSTQIISKAGGFGSDDVYLKISEQVLKRNLEVRS